MRTARPSASAGPPCRPVHSGLRFSRNAALPSCASSAGIRTDCPSRSIRRPVSVSALRQAPITCLAMPSASGARSRSVRAKTSVPSSNSSGANTRFARLHLSAVPAETGSVVIIISLSRPMPIMRDAAPDAGMTPMSFSVSMNSADVDAMRKSLAAAISTPPPAHTPLTIEITGFSGFSRSSSIS